MKHEISFLVVTYNKKISESKTLKFISDSINNFPESKFGLLIWNNGPFKDLEAVNFIENNISENLFDVFFVESISNDSLALIYNKFFELFDSEKYVIFDDDSIPSVKYVNYIIDNKESAIIVPKIISHDKIHGPHLNGERVYYDIINKCLDDNKLMAIGSGVCIRKSFIALMKKKYKTVFDERFALYGVDTTFFLRVFSMPSVSKKQIYFSCFSYINHSLSSLENEDYSKKLMRLRERGIDAGLTIRYYSKYFFLFHLFYFLFKRFSFLILKKAKLKEEILFIRWVIFAVYKGKHPRS